MLPHPGTAQRPQPWLYVQTMRAGYYRVNDAGLIERFGRHMERFGGTTVTEHRWYPWFAAPSRYLPAAVAAGSVCPGFDANQQGTPMPRIRELPLHERPASRISDHGPDALSDAELLALVSGQHGLEICQRSLCAYQGWVGLLRADMRAVAASIGTPRKAASLKAALEIGRRLLVAGYEGRYQVKSPADVAQRFMVEMLALDQEELWVACLDTKNRLIKIAKVYRGSVNTAMIRVGEVYKEPLRLNAAAIIVAHNHPSSDPTPSPEDILVTRQIVEAGKLLDVDALDHLVLGGNRYVSLRERGLGVSS